MSMNIFDKTIEIIDEHYLFSLSPKLILALLVATGICLVVLGLLFIWYKRKTTLATSTIGHLHKLIPSLKEKKTIPESLLPILSEFVHPTTLKIPILMLLMLFPKNHHLPAINNLYLQWFNVVIIPNPTN